MKLPYPLNRLFLGVGGHPVRDTVTLARRLFAGFRTAYSVLYLPERPPLPIRVQIENTNRCNLRCIMCARRFHGPAGRDMPDDGFVRLISEIRPVYVTLNGDGEPLLDPGIFVKIAAAKRLGCVVSLPSNMTLMDEDRARRIVELGVDLVTVSLDAATRDTYERIRCGAEFDKVIANTRRLHRLAAEAQSPIKVTILLVIQKANLFEYNEALQLQRELQIPLQLTPVRFLEWGEIAAACKPSESELELLREQIGRRLASEPDESVRAFLRRWLATAEKIREYTRPGRVCLKPWTTCYITAEGEVYPCCLAVSADKSLLLGNALESSFRSVWHGNAYISLRRQMLAERRSVPICGDCNVEEAGLQQRFASWFRWLPNRLRRAWPEKSR